MVESLTRQAQQIRISGRIAVSMRSEFRETRFMTQKWLFSNRNQSDSAVAAEHGLTADEYARIQKILGRDPNYHRAGHFQRDVERALLV